MGFGEKDFKSERIVNRGFDFTNDAHRTNLVASDLSTFSTATNGAVNVGLVSTSVLAASTARKYVALVNDSDEAIYLALAGTAVKHQGIRLSPYGGTYTINASNLYTGAISAICEHGGKVLCYVHG